MPLQCRQLTLMPSLGLQISMYFQSVYYLNLNIGKENPKSKAFYIAYSTALMILITIALASNLFFGQAMWIEHRDVDGGPVAYFAGNIAAWYNTFGTAADVTANVLGDGLMVCSDRKCACRTFTS